MNNLDFSQLSDISTISRISRSSQLMGRLDSILLSNELEHHSSLIQNNKATTAPEQDHHDVFREVTKSFIDCQNSISEYAKVQLIYECLKEICLNKNIALPDETKDKLKGLLESYEINKIKDISITLKQGLEDLSILGIQDFPKYKLSYEERLNVKACVDALMQEKLHDFLLKYEELGGNVKELQKLNSLNTNNQLTENTDLELLKWKDKFDNILAHYKDRLIQSTDLINEWRKVKNEDVKEIYDKKAQILSLQSQIAEVQAKVAKLTCLIKMYTETPKTIESYKILNNTLDDKMLELSNEIKRKSHLKKLYLDLQNTEYDNILKTYLHLCSAIKKKKQIMEML
ncbi:PREDICTED: uncharacterized protein LOC107073548 [Polistes dominula]|uniref:Uncharacterized protein LOC107073548 n=1 Tax=Polistes dominula TaxID=743375 RepID=A0ABM1JB85_POLDO|nr:PREDICTED: uncharacterized protein LOC107073548 [Polistes dominula]